MIIFDFITPEEIADLPDDDPQSAFTQFVKIAQKRLGERSAELQPSDESDWETLREARLGFMNVVIAAAKKYEIEPFASMDVPRVKDFGDGEHRQFRADLDHYLTQLLLDNSSRSKRESILVTAELATTIRTYVFHLRELIEKASDLDEGKRRVLLRRLTEFEAELEKKRLSLIAVSMLAITLVGAPGAIWTSADAANRLLTNILRVVGEAKSADDATRLLPPSAAPMTLTGPRRQEKHSDRSFDDDIPF
ncbi:hypothetical protein [Bradyrhizobium sp. STM 3809]|uniref:hypothetical protein n=1 Tax=Bradyrhizobium sp. STM 3809 TaxID=551936 RepID=UPI000240760E|nr:hypothetical protein [Bradyrhizobium sp. STM 3809]CCD97769.1 conserved hypothetical protein [Bradyrhizobium sp. STM 3809]